MGDLPVVAMLEAGGTGVKEVCRELTGISSGCCCLGVLDCGLEPVEDGLIGADPGIIGDG